MIKKVQNKKVSIKSLRVQLVEKTTCAPTEGESLRSNEAFRSKAAERRIWKTCVSI